MSLWTLADALSLEFRAVPSPALTCELRGVDEPSRLRPGTPVPEPVRRVVSEIFRANRWKFWEAIPLRFGSASGSGVPEREGGALTLTPKVTPPAPWGRILSEIASWVVVSPELGNTSGAVGAISAR